MLGLALREPDVIGGHGPPMLLPEVGGCPLDQGGGVGELPFEGLLMGLVGDEDRAGQAARFPCRSFAAAGACTSRWARSGPPGRAGAGVVVLAGENDAGAVGLQLDGGQERLLGVFFPLGDVVQGHRRGGVPGIALQDVDRQADLGETGQPGVPEPVGMAEPDRRPCCR